jgi:hypothetical protein
MAKAEEFLRVSHTEQMLSQTMSSVLNQTKSGAMQQMFGVTLTPEQTKQSEELQSKLVTILTNALSSEKIKPIYVKLYADTYIWIRRENAIFRAEEASAWLPWQVSFLRDFLSSARA